MAFQVAIALLEDEVTPTHFGKAECFGIYRIGAGEYQQIEVRGNEPPCLGSGRHHDGRLAAAADRIADCRYLLAVNTGPGAQQVLAERGVYCLSPLGPIEEALAKLAATSAARREG